MRRSTGAILRDRRPATIIKSDWRGDARKTSAPNRATSYRDALIDIISMAQHARPNVHGQIADFRAQLTTFSTVVVRTGISICSSCCSRPKRTPACGRGGASLHKRRAPIEHALAPDVNVTSCENGREEHDLDVPGPPEITHRHRPRIEEGHLDVEKEEHHRDEIELHGLSLAGVADGRHAALVGRALLGRRPAGSEQVRHEDGERPEADGNG